MYGKFFGKNRRESRRQGWVGFLVLVGAILALGGGFLTIVSAFGTGIGEWVVTLFNVLKVLTAAGAVMWVVGMVLAFQTERTQFKGPQTGLDGARVVARFALDKADVLYTEMGMIEFLDKPRYFVRLYTPRDGSVEYRCSPEVFWMCGEGLIGRAEVQGNWLGSFTPTVGAHHTGVGESF